MSDITGDKIKVKDFCECSVRKAETVYKKFIAAKNTPNATEWDSLQDGDKLLWLKMAGRKPLGDKKVDGF